MLKNTSIAAMGAALLFSIGCGPDLGEDTFGDGVLPEEVTTAEHGLAVTRTRTRFYADANADQQPSMWSYNTGAAAVRDRRSTTLWGVADPECGPGPLPTFARPGSALKFASCTATSPNYGPSGEGDEVRNGVLQHRMLTVGAPVGGAGFLAPFGAAGQDGKGANKGIAATYTTFNPTFTDANAVLPWGAAPSPTNGLSKLRMAFRTWQSVPSTSLSEPSRQQLQQAIDFSVINRACKANFMASSSAKCQLNFNIKVFNQGVYAYSPTSNGSVFFDPGQGGIPVVLGPINSTSRVTNGIVNGRAIPLWTSWATATQTVPFTSDAKFQIEISWAQFVGILNAISGSNPQNLWGPQWADRMEWALLRVGYGQEAASTVLPGKNRHIDGYVKSVEVLSITH